MMNIFCLGELIYTARAEQAEEVKQRLHENPV